MAAWLFDWLAQRFASQLKFARNHFFVRTQNFDPNQPSAEGKLIGNEASRKLSFGNSDDAMDDKAG